MSWRPGSIGASAGFNVAKWELSFDLRQPSILINEQQEDIRCNNKKKKMQRKLCLLRFQRNFQSACPLFQWRVISAKSRFTCPRGKRFKNIESPIIKKRGKLTIILVHSHTYAPNAVDSAGCCLSLWEDGFRLQLHLYVWRKWRNGSKRPTQSILIKLN